MDELKSPTLARPLDRAAMGNDIATLRNLVGMLNNPEITGAVVPQEEREAAHVPGAATASPEQMVREEAVAAKRANAQAEAEIMRATLEVTKESLPTPPVAKPQPASQWKLPITKKFFFTGAGKAGKSWLAAQLGARVFELDDPIRAMAASAFGEYKEESYAGFAHEVYAWGEGLVTKSYPLTAARSMFVESIRGLEQKGIRFDYFGRAGFWMQTLLERVLRFREEFPNEVVVVTDVGTPDQLSALKNTGFLHFHVMCNQLTRTNRGGLPAVSSLVQAIEQDITKQVSQHPRGAKLWCVWCDENYQVPAGRLLSTEEFLGGAR